MFSCNLSPALLAKGAPLVEFMYLVFTCIPGENYGRRLRSLLFTCGTYFERKLTPLLVDSRQTVIVCWYVFITTNIV